MVELEMKKLLSGEIKIENYTVAVVLLIKAKM